MKIWSSDKWLPTAVIAVYITKLIKLGKLTHCPTVDDQPMMLDCTQAWDLIFELRSTVVLDRHTPEG